MTTTKPDTRPARQYVYVTRPRCPACGSHKLLTYRTSQNGDDTLTRYAKCGDCGARLILVVE